ncbi:MFS transporter [Dictyobacter aurantiacus]|uniref:MFS transporter n=1 Tax=Dictyobacter aurantiacus TaxID=1936993 RepID=A0A401ZF75_9CHLR|nr:MFS transporter [Dictyobacter aurantiacus]GCE05534.1 MFS transporter [Dictyobacter aurantiacus]
MSLTQHYIQQFGRFQRNARLYLISNALSGMTLGILQVLYNLYLIALGYQTDFIGLILFAGTIGAGVAIFPAGLCIDRFTGRSILIWASVLVGIAGAGQILLRTPFFLLLSAFMAGIGGAFILVVNAPFLARNSTPDERSHLFSLNIVLTLIMTVLGEALGGVLPLWFRSSAWLMAPLPPWFHWALAQAPQARSYQLSLLVAGIIATPSFIPLFMLREEPPERRADPTSSGTTLRDRLSVLSGWRRLPPRMLLNNPLTVMIGIQLLIGAGAGLLLPYFNVYFVKQLGANSALFGAIDAAANTLNALLTLLAPWLVLRIGKVAALVIPRVISLPIMLLIGITGSLPLAATLYPLRQGFMDMTQGILQVFSMEVVPPQRRGLANSGYQAAYQIMWALGASLGGFLISRVGYLSVFISTTILYSLALLLLWTRFGHGRWQEPTTSPIQPEHITMS